MNTIVENFTSSGRTITYYKGRMIHRDDGPAEMQYNLCGELVSSVWYRNNVYHNSDGPACIKDMRTWKSREWWIDGKLHRENGPAIITKWPGGFSRIEYYIGGVRHRVDRPAIVEKTRMGVSRLDWYTRGELHNDTSPAVLHFHINRKISLREWYSHGVFHRDDGPAREKYTETGELRRTEWWQHGQRHNANGPAIIKNNGKTTMWYRNGRMHANSEGIFGWKINDLKHTEFRLVGGQCRSICITRQYDMKYDCVATTIKEREFKQDNINIVLGPSIIKVVHLFSGKVVQLKTNSVHLREDKIVSIGPIDPAPWLYNIVPQPIAEELEQHLIVDKRSPTMYSRDVAHLRD